MDRRARPVVGLKVKLMELQQVVVSLLSLREANRLQHELYLIELVATICTTKGKQAWSCIGACI